MAKFLDTQAISNELMKLIKEAKEKIILVSYSFKVNPQIQERLKTKSKMRTLSEIVVVYGNTELRHSDLEWIKDIDDLKIIEKSNLHAKCYLNEDRAIICSMNLYDYSQQNNIEMGVLISKEHDQKAYEELIDEINNIKINGNRKDVGELLTREKDTRPIPKPLNPVTPESMQKSDKLTLEQKLNFEILKKWRLHKSKEEKTPAFTILSDAEIRALVSRPKLDKNAIFESIPKKNAIKYAEQILDELSYSNKYTIGEITSVWYQTDETKYDRVKLKLLHSGEEKWFDTTQELPTRERKVAVQLNKTWFNEYFYIE